MQDVARSREFESVTRVLEARRHRVWQGSGIPLFDCPVWQCNRWGDSSPLFEPVVYPILIWHKHYFVGPKANRYQLDAKCLAVERKRWQPQRLRERSDITLPINHFAMRFDFDQVREFPTHGICFIHDRRPRMPNLFERVTDNSATDVGQARVLPAQHDCDFSREILLGT